MINRLSNLLVASVLSVLLVACASGEQKPSRPELIEQADKTISSGVFSYNQSDFAKAEELFLKALYRYRGIDNPDGVASSCINLAKTRLSQGDTVAAQQWIDSAQTVIESAALSHLQNHVAIVRSSIAIETGEYAAAKRQLAPLLDEADKTIDIETRLAALQNRTRIAFNENQDAATWIERYAKQLTSNEPLHQARLARFRAALAADDETSNTHFNDALVIYRRLAHRTGIAATLSEWAQRDMAHQRYDSAKNRLERALFIRSELMDRGNCKEILELLARIYLDTNKNAERAKTANWIEKVTTTNFSQWRELTEAYSGFPQQ